MAFFLILYGWASLKPNNNGPQSAYDRDKDTGRRIIGGGQETLNGRPVLPRGMEPYYR